MDYLKIYNTLVETRQQTRDSKQESNYEIHHVLPRCLGGSDESTNLVKLTYREHYIAHWLLIKIYPNEPKIYYGFLCMLRDPHGNRKLTSRMVETIKTNYSAFQKWNWTINNPMHKDDIKRKFSERMKKNNPNKGGAWNHTSFPVKIIFEDGSSKTYSFMKDAADTLNIPYASMKLARRKNLPMKKYGILTIKKLEAENDKNKT